MQAVESLQRYFANLLFQIFIAAVSTAWEFCCFGRAPLPGMKFSSEAARVTGTVGKEGGHIASYDKTVSIDIPLGAVLQPKAIDCYRYVPFAKEGGIWDQDDQRLVQLSPTVRCGPDDTRFEKPIQIRVHHQVSNFGHTLLNACTLQVFTRRKGTKWIREDSASVTVEGPWMLINIRHFSDYMVAIPALAAASATLDIMCSTLMTRTSLGNLHMYLVFTYDNKNDHECFQGQVYNNLDDRTATKVYKPEKQTTHSNSGPQNQLSWPNISPLTEIHYEVISHQTGAVQTGVIGEDYVSQLAGSGHAVPIDLGLETTACDIRLFQLLETDADNSIAVNTIEHRFTANFDYHLSEKETEYKFSRHDTLEVS